MADSSVFIALPSLERKQWVRFDHIVGLHRNNLSTSTEVHLVNGEILLADEQPERIMHRLFNAERLLNGGS